MAKQDDYVRYTVRLPSDLYSRVQEAAGEKSVNAEIAERLSRSFDWPILAKPLLNAIEDSAEANSHSIQDEILARLEFTKIWDSDYFNPASDNAMVLDPNYRLQAVEDQLGELARLVRKLAGEPEPSFDLSEGGSDERPYKTGTPE